MLYGVNQDPSASEVRKFGVTIFIGLGVIGALLWWLAVGDAEGAGLHVTIALWAVGAVVAAVSFASHAAGKAIYVVWMTLAMWMGKIMVPVFLTVMYFVFLIPFTLIRFKDPLRLKLKREGTYWEKHAPFEPTIERMSRLF